MNQSDRNEEVSNLVWWVDPLVKIPSLIISYFSHSQPFLPPYTFILILNISLEGSP